MFTLRISGVNEVNIFCLYGLFFCVVNLFLTYETLVKH